MTHDKPTRPPAPTVTTPTVTTPATTRPTRRRKPERPPRVVKPKDPPLDDGVRDGPELWRTFDEVVFTHWDRWLLRLAWTERGGLDGIGRQFRERVRGSRASHEQRDAEAMLAQVLDLQSRLARTGHNAETLLDDTERASEWLYKRAFQRVWHGGPRRRTQAMRDTPRALLSQRAGRGHWASFPASPAQYEAPLRDVVGDTSNVPHWATGDIAFLIESFVELRVLVATSAERLALRRAAMTVIVGVMNDVDDSLAAMATCYGEIERAYLDDLCAFPARATLLRDLIEFATWEDYGLTQGVEGFLAKLDEHDADAALHAVTGVIRELRAEVGLEYQLQAARRLRAAVLRAGDAFDDRS